MFFPRQNLTKDILKIGFAITAMNFSPGLLRSLKGVRQQRNMDYGKIDAQNYAIKQRCATGFLIKLEERAIFLFQIHPQKR